jgi:di/tricarboxylate transporter
MEGVAPAGPVQHAAAPRMGRQLCEVVVSSTSPLLGESIRDANFRSRYNASVLAVHRSGERLEQKIGKIVLKAGDTLLIDADDDFVRRWRHSPDFILVSGVEDSAPVVHDRAGLALLIFFFVIAGMSVSSFGPMLGSVTRATGLSLAGLNPALFALAGAVLMVLCGCVRATDGHRSIQLSVILLVGAALGIGEALETSGAAAWLAKGMLSATQGASPVVVMGVIYLLTMVLSEFLSNNATAAMMGSLAIAAASQLKVDPRPFLIAVAIASSCAFATPIGYQTNLMVLNPGGYRFSDYLKVGLPLNILCMIIAVILVPLFWSFGGP